MSVGLPVQGRAVMSNVKLPADAAHGLLTLTSHICKPHALNREKEMQHVACNNRKASIRLTYTKVHILAGALV